MTQPVFVVGTGRCGTAAVQRLLDANPLATAHHEYGIGQVQPLSVKHYQGLMGWREAASNLLIIYPDELAMGAEVWADCSNKLSFLITPLHEAFPTAKFVYLVRDGRKVVSSYYHKLKGEIYEDEHVIGLGNWLNGYGPEPPPEKPYWWPLPEDRDEFITWTRFQRIAWFWAECNRVILRDITQTDNFIVKLEDLVSDHTVVFDLFNFLGLPFDLKYWQMLQRPHNVSEPKNYLLTPTQTELFWETPGVKEMMEFFDYVGPEYKVRY